MSASPFTAARVQNTTNSIATLAWETLGFFTQPARIFRGYHRQDLRYDLISGLTVAAIMLPQAIVYSFIAGMPPVTGLYTAILGSIVAALWGSSKQAQSGPTNTHALMTMAVTMTVATVGTPEFVAAAGLLTVMVGTFKLLVGVTRLGVLANFVSDAVIVGFTAGAGILIAINQLPHLLGISIPPGSGFVGTLQQVFLHLGEINIPSAALGFSAILTIIILTRVNKKLPSVLIAVVLSALVVAVFHLDEKGAAIIGALPRGLPPLADLPFTDWQLIGKLSAGALAAGAIGLVQTTSITRSLSSVTRQRVDSNQEFVGQGLANIASGLFSGFLVTTSFNRSALNLQSGARTQVAAISSGLFVLIGMLLLAPYAAFIPNAALAGVLMVIAYRMIDMAEIKRLLHGGRGDAVIMITTLLATLLIPLEYAVLLGIVLSLGRYILRTSMPQVLPLVPDEHYKHLVYQPNKPQCPQLAVVEIRGDLYFGAVSHVEKTILEIKRQNPEQCYLLLRMQNVQVIDISGIHMLESLLNAYRESGGDMYLVKVRGPVHQRMKDLGFIDRLGEDHLLEEDEAISHIFYRVLDPVVCIYECNVRVFAECQNLPRPSEHLDIPPLTAIPNLALPMIKPIELYQALQGNDPPVVVDVREQREFRRSHIPQALNVPLSKILTEPLQIPLDQTLVLVCRTIRRSRRAAYVLQKQGFQNIMLLDGGMLAWENADLLTAVDFFTDAPEQIP